MYKVSHASVCFGGRNTGADSCVVWERERVLASEMATIHRSCSVSCYKASAPVSTRRGHAH